MSLYHQLLIVLLTIPYHLTKRLDQAIPVTLPVDEVGLDIVVRTLALRYNSLTVVEIAADYVLRLLIVNGDVLAL